MAGATTYLCRCNDCGHTFTTQRMPHAIRRGHPAAQFRKGRPVPQTNAGQGHRSAAVRRDRDDYKSTVRCPHCKGRHVTRAAVMDGKTKGAS